MNAPALRVREGTLPGLAKNTQRIALLLVFANLIRSELRRSDSVPASMSASPRNMPVCTTDKTDLNERRPEVAIASRESTGNSGAARAVRRAPSSTISL